MAFVKDPTLAVLMREVMKRSVRGVNAMLEAGANVNGSLQHRPLLGAASLGDITMVKFLIENGADVNAPELLSIDCAANHDVILNGERALHVAIVCNHIHVMRELLKAGADPNAGSLDGNVPLRLVSMFTPAGCQVDVVRELLAAGANPALRDGEGASLLHHATSIGNVDLTSMLVSRLPKCLLSTVDGKGRTPLYLAAKLGNERMLSILLSVGATHPIHDHLRCCPLLSSIEDGHEDVVRLLTTKEGMKALGDSSIVLFRAVICAAHFRHPRILRLVLTADGEDKERFWARQHSNFMSVLHYAATCGHLNTVRLLLAAGADEASVDCHGHLPWHVIGKAPRIQEISDKETLDAYKTEFAAVHRELKRGPAFRARSWAWPVQRVINPAAAGHYDAVVKPVATSAARKAPVLGVRVLRRRKSNNYFVELVGRHAQKV